MSPLPQRNRRLIRSFLTALILPALIAAAFGTSYQTAHAASIRYVNDNVSGGLGDGSSWANAFPKLQDAIAAASSGDQIYVAAGVYYPDEGSGRTDNNAANNFPLRAGIALYGGFAGTESSPNQRNIAASPTVLSGDLQKNDATNASGVLTDSTGIIGTNAVHVVTALFPNNLTRLDGFIITGGKTTDNGGGLYGTFGTATLTNLTFQGNYANHGGGALIVGDSAPVMSKLAFIGNFAESDGGGLEIRDDVKPILSELTFISNTTVYIGGGLFVINTEVAIDKATFTGNSVLNSLSGGGGLAIWDTATVTVTQATFDHNQAYEGGGLYNKGRLTLSDATFTGNEAVFGSGGGVYSDGPQADLTTISFIGNRAENGGGMHLIEGGAHLTKVSFVKNIAFDAALDVYTSSPILEDVIFKGNAGYRGAIFNSESTPSLTNVLFVGNHDNTIDNYSSSDRPTVLTLTNVTFAGNAGKAIFEEGNSQVNSTVYFQNVIIWGNTPATFTSLPSYSYSHSLIQSLALSGNGNLDGTNAANDPRFVHAVNCGSNGCPDDPATGVDESADNDYGDQNLQDHSPAIDSGDNAADTDRYVAGVTPISDVATDLAGNPRLARVTAASAVIDLGAYEHINLPSVANAGGPYSGNEGSNIALDGSHANDPDGSIISYAWDCTNNGSNEAAAAAPTGSTCTYPNDGFYTLQLTTVDNLGVSNSATAQVTVANVAPVLTPANNQSTFAGNAKQFNLGSFIDPGAEAVWPVTIDWGDDTTPSQVDVHATGTLPKTSHTYATAGSYNVLVTVNDGNASDDAGFVVTVNAAQAGAPAVTPPADQVAVAGVDKSFTLGSFTDANSPGPWQVTVNWGDSSGETAFSASADGTLAARPHTYAAAGSYSVLVSVSDDALTGSASFRITASAESNSGSVTGVVYADANGNSAPDAGEGIPGATISLATAGQANAAAVDLTRTTTSDANGNYRLDNLPPNDYTLTITPPSGYATQGTSQETVTITNGETTTAPAFTLKPTVEGDDHQLFLPGMFKPAK